MLVKAARLKFFRPKFPQFPLFPLIYWDEGAWNGYVLEHSRIYLLTPFCCISFCFIDTPNIFRNSESSSSSFNMCHEQNKDLRQRSNLDMRSNLLISDHRSINYCILWVGLCCTLDVEGLPFLQLKRAFEKLVDSVLLLIQRA